MVFKCFENDFANGNPTYPNPVNHTVLFFILEFILFISKKINSLFKFFKKFVFRVVSEDFAVVMSARECLMSPGLESTYSGLNVFPKESC